ncbi:MAG: N-acetylmuramoyl-L-alanine amidase, partial [Lachnospiraceae bacterium]|nr:N-acetylmuramoyl-L-alanine amidase [Lachnospiraceae bacterium]
DYIVENRYSRPGTPLLQVKDIVIHYVANPGTSAKQNRDYFNGLADQSGDDVTYTSSNFIVGLEGEIIAVVPIEEIAYCSNNRNNDTISIETCHPDETGKFNEKTYASLVRLTAWLCDNYGLDSSHVIRHYDVTGKLCPLYFVEHEDAWETFKADVQTEIDSLRAAG